ncbi:YheC/YheD family protein [Paenibacillus sp. P25]|nr:YheC/YheD family protein [Paenibacillus sp. P25]
MKYVKYKLGKLGKYQFMRKYSEVADYLPETRLATKSNIDDMLNKYSALYVKPDKGTGGFSIYKITKSGSGFVSKSGTVTKRFASLDALYRSFRKLPYKDKYIAQRGIEPLKHNHRPFDIRVMVQKDKRGRLKATGIVGRLAKPGKIVTNFHSGGRPLPVEILLSSHLRGEDRSRYIKELEALGKRAGKVLRKSYRSKPAFGVDIAIDSRMKPWVLEVNTMPDKSIFNALRDKTMYKRILRYANAATNEGSGKP